MELGLSLGDACNSLGFMENSATHHLAANKGLGFCMALSIASSTAKQLYTHADDDDDDDDEDTDKLTTNTPSVDPPVPLDLLPNTPVPRNPPSLLAFPWSSDNGSSEAGSSGQMARGFDVNKFPFVEQVEDGGALSSSPNNSAASSFQMDFCMYSGGHKKDFGNVGNETGAERGSSRFSDEDENGCTRKKLRLSKEQSAFLEESFKEHNTLNPKQKLALAKQLNLRPRQVEVWFQNRRARTKLKQTEVDCEYLKRCCETLTEENRRLHKELQELRALKTSNSFYMQLPATTLTMCPSCERVATTTTTTTTDPTSKASEIPNRKWKSAWG
ncbi:homeobox-leucine zipper protein HOX11-like isoform X3 [Mangifera indica]|uniref:homeobox-leucine zipper protein HOX11-like isoform X3 n=1 Tax=Mangifera indica TaxID=29780 RepID=UPI001CFA009F|nr:homeobox-leucine zipper protein HOX11-like isoform X3 [Mangifera indica]